jgi:hypothetical protein
MKTLYYINLVCLGVNFAAYVVNPTLLGAFWVVLTAGATYVLREAAV